MKCVLLLDDSVDLLLLEKLLIERRCGSCAVTASSYDDVVRLGEKIFDCDIAILDINLGQNQPSGLDVYRWLRKQGFRSPIYFLTGHARSFPGVAEAERLGDAKVLSKPISPNEMVGIIRGVEEKSAR